MFVEHVLRIVVSIIGVVIAVYWIISWGNLAWFHPEKLEKRMSERAKYHLINVYNPKYDWKAVIWMARVFTRVGALALLILGIEILLGLIQFML